MKKKATTSSIETLEINRAFLIRSRSDMVKADVEVNAGEEETTVTFKFSHCSSTQTSIQQIRTEINLLLDAVAKKVSEVEKSMFPHTTILYTIESSDRQPEPEEEKDYDNDD